MCFIIHSMSYEPLIVSILRIRKLRQFTLPSAGSFYSRDTAPNPGLRATPPHCSVLQAEKVSRKRSLIKHEWLKEVRASHRPKDWNVCDTHQPCDKPWSALSLSFFSERDGQVASLTGAWGNPPPSCSSLFSGLPLLLPSNMCLLSTYCVPDTG